MTLKRVVVELGMGTDLQGEDYTKAACRAVHNALRQNSLTVFDAFGLSHNDMMVEIEIAVAHPDRIDTKAVADMLPYGERRVKVSHGGMDIAKESGGFTVLANAAISVFLDLPDNKTWVA